MQYFYSLDTQAKLLDHPLFQPMTSYLLEHETQEVILRQLKQQFPQKKMEHFLDQMIDAGLIIRENRRYRCGFSVYGENDFQTEIAQLTKALLQELSKLSEKERALFVAEDIWDFCHENVASYFYATSFSVPSVKRLEAGNETYRFVTFQKGEKPVVSLPTYFHFQKKQTPLPAGIQELGRLIGDVNEDYFFDQVEIIVDRVCENKYKKRRESIFLNALLFAGVIDHQENYHLMLPIVKEKERTALQVYEPITETNEQRAFIKEQALIKVMEQLDFQSYDYIKKN